MRENLQKITKEFEETKNIYFCLKFDDQQNFNQPKKKDPSLYSLFKYKERKGKLKKIKYYIDEINQLRLIYY